MYLYGKNSVLERIKANPAGVEKLFVEHGTDYGHIINLAKKSNIPVERVSGRELARIKSADRLQGIVARVDNFKYAPFEELLEQGEDKKLSLLCLDGLNDPHNLGSIIRSAACFGGFAVIIPKHGSCEVNDTVMHVASGGENYVPVSMVNNMPTALIKAKRSGFWVAGTAVDEGDDIRKTDLPKPVCLVMGSEGKGIRHGVAKQLDLKINLPMHGAPLSFNVAMASAIFCYEISKQKST